MAKHFELEIGEGAFTHLTAEGLPVHGFSSLLAELSTLTRNRAAVGTPDASTVEILSQPTPLQARALEFARASPLAKRPERADPEA